MKKIILILFCFIFASCFAFDYSGYCSSQAPQKDFKGNLASVSGINLLSRKVAAHVITKELKKQTGSKFKVRINNFYGIALTDGIFKDLTIKGNNFVYDDMIISNLTAQTLCPYNHIQYKDDKVTYLENMVLSYDLYITQDDLNEFVKSSKFQQAINKVNQDKYLSSIFKIENISAQIQEDRLTLQYRINPLPKGDNSIISFAKNLIKPFDVKIGAGLKVVDNKIEFCDMDLNSQKIDYTYFLPLVNMFNPTSHKIKIDKDNDAEVKIDNIKLSSSKISIKGVIIVKSENNK